MVWKKLAVEYSGLVVKPYSRGITNYLYPAVKCKTGLTALTTAAVSPRVQRNELYAYALLKSFQGSEAPQAGRIFVTRAF